MNHLNNHRLFRPLVLAILVLVSFAMARTASAQDTKSMRSISGRVADASGQGIPGVGIIVKGTTMGVITTDDGSFELQNVSDGSTIVVSCMGYVEQEFRIISTKSVYNVVLSEDEMLLDDVVVVGYGTQKKEHLTGAVAQVTAKELENRPVANLGQALQGMVPNLKVTVSSGKPGAGASFQIRGTGSPNGGSPLILVDGVESYPDRINTNDIESISVLKDAASSAIYGARAAFGVILITTKNGRKNQKATISYDGYFAFSSSTTSTDSETRGYYSAGIADFFLESGRGVRYTNYTDATLPLLELQPEVLFLDVEVPGKTGLEFLQSIRPRVNFTFKVVFYSGFSDYMLDAIRQSAFDFLLKPYKQSKLRTIIDRIVQDMESNTKVRHLIVKDMPHKIAMQIISELLLVSMEEMLLFNYISDHRSWQLTLTDGTSHMLRKGLTAEDILKVHPIFARISNTVIINLTYLAAVENYTQRCRLCPPFEHIVISASRRYFGKLKERFELL